MKSKLEKAILDSMNKNPNNWNGIFYYNPKDPRVLVRRIKPAMGWSFNWASPYSYISPAGLPEVLQLFSRRLAILLCQPKLSSKTEALVEVLPEAGSLAVNIFSHEL